MDPNQQLKIVVLQNHRWMCSQGDPAFDLFRNSYEYTSDDAYTFPAGKPWRWLDIQVFVFKVTGYKGGIFQRLHDHFVKPDPDRSHSIYYFYDDLNGFTFKPQKALIHSGRGLCICTV